jgi:capsular polysaccharide biosynthesis protein
MKLQRGQAVPSSHESSESTAGFIAAAPASLPAYRDEQIIRLNILRALQLHRSLALGFAATGLLLALTYAILMWPVYTAKSQIHIQPMQPKAMSPGNDQTDTVNAAAYDAYVQQQVQSATSPAVLASALKKLGPGTWQRGNESEQAAAERLKHAIDAARVGTGYEVLITSRAPDPALSAKIANAVADSIAEKASGEGNVGVAQRIMGIVRLRNRFSIVNEQLHNLTVEDSAPGAVHVSVAAKPPLHPSLDKILKGALLLALGGLLLGLLAAILANKLDPHVYTGADLEQALGFAPIAVLPDFDEVSDSVAAEYLKRLAASIKHAGRKGDLQTCVLTGTVRTGDPMQDAPENEAYKELLKQVVSHADFDQEGLLLNDTAPLVLSAEAEYLVRSFDCAPVVIQSGVTARAQLLAAVNTLHRLEVGAIGFDLNPVSLAKADPAFRHSLYEIEKHLRNQGASSSMWPVRWRGFVDEPPREPEYVAKDHELPEHSEHTPGAADERTPSTVYEFPKAPIELPSRPKPALPNDAEMPWWLLPPSSSVKPEASVVETCAAESVQTDYPDSAPPRIPAPKLPDWFWEGSTSGTGDFTRLAAEHAAATTEQMPLDSESRIERLRGLLSNVGLGNLSRKRGLFPPDEQQSSPATIADPRHVDTPAVEPSRVVVPAEKASEAVATPQDFDKPEVLSPKEFVPVKVQKSRSDASSSTGWNDDEIRILPSKPGQYGSR